MRMNMRKSVLAILLTITLIVASAPSIYAFQSAAGEDQTSTTIQPNTTTPPANEANDAVPTDEEEGSLHDADSSSNVEDVGLLPNSEDDNPSGIVESQTNAVITSAAEVSLSSTLDSMFELSADGTTIIQFIQASDYPVYDVVIPDEIKPGVKITAIGDSAFTGRQLKSVTIPSTITSIGANAFYNNPALTTVTFIGASALQSIGNNAFKNCSTLNGFTVPSGVTSLGSGVFSGCSALSAIAIPSGVSTLAQETFYNCTSLSSVSLPEGLASIGASAFFNNTALTNITLPSTLSLLGDGAFSLCTALSAITLPESLTTIGAYSFKRCQALTEVVVPASVTTIKADAFQETSSNLVIDLTVHEPDSISGKPWGASTQLIYWKSSDTSCFYLRQDGMIAGLKPAGHDGAGACQHPTWHQTASGDIEIPSSIGGVTVVGLAKNAFVNNQNIKSVVFASDCSFTAIGEGAFSGCGRMTSIVLPNAIETIESSAFYNCGALSDVTLSSNLKTIGTNAFTNSFALKSILFPEGLQTISTGAFGGSSLTPSVTLPGSVTNVGSGAFGSCNGLQKIYIEGTNTARSFSTNAFSSLKNTLTDIYIEEMDYDTLPGQPWNAQYATVHWKDKEYPSEIIETTGTNAEGENIAGFEYNRIHNRFVGYVGPTGKDVDLTVPFSFEHEGTTYTADLNNPNIPTLKDKTFGVVKIEEGYTGPFTLFAYGGNSTNIDEIVLPSTTTVTGDGFAQNNINLKKVNLPEGLKTISNNSFDGCTGLTDIDNLLPNSVTTIGINAFNKVPLGRDNLAFSSGINAVGSKAFNGCGLTGDIVFPSSITSVERDAFTNNPGITSITFDVYRSDVPALSSNVPFMTDRNDVNIYFKGELPHISHQVESDTDFVNTPLTRIKLSAFMETNPNTGKPIAYLAGLWMSPDGTFENAVSIFSGGINVIAEEPDLALPNGTYTFFVASSVMIKEDVLDPEQFITYELTIDKTLPLTVSANDFTLFSNETGVGNLTQSEVLTRASAAAHEPCYDIPLSIANGELALSNTDLAAVNALSSHGETVEIAVLGDYSGTYTYTGSVPCYYGTGSDGKDYPYTVSGSQNIIVTYSDEYTITFDEGVHATIPGALAGKLSSVHTFNENMPAEPLVIPDTGYRFTGWKQEDTGTIYNPGALPAKVVGNATYVAQCEQIEYTLSFNLNGGTSAPIASQKLYYNTLATAPASIPTRAGYTFAGWYKDAAGTMSWNFATDRMPDHDVTLYASWNASPPYVPPVNPPVDPPVVPPVVPPASDTPAPWQPDTYNPVQQREINQGTSPSGGFGVGETWSLLNLILSIMALLGTVFSVVFTIIRGRQKDAQKDQDKQQPQGRSQDTAALRAASGQATGQDDKSTEEKGQKKRWVSFVVTLILPLVFGLIPGILFLILEDVTLSMTWINEWTPLIGVSFIVAAVVIIICAIKSATNQPFTVYFVDSKQQASS